MTTLTSRASYDVAGIYSKTKTAEPVPPSVRFIKRSLDVLVACIGLFATAWLFPIIAFAIYIDSPGPIFYRQRRAGAIRPTRRPDRYEFEEFDMFKFRTMRVDAEKFTGAVLAQENDPRITRVGRFLRKSRLDELPQLFNVLRGEMTLVGPRPERRELLAQLILAIPYFEERMRDVRPGITGLAQISLGYSGRALEGSEVKPLEETLVNPFDLEGVEGSEADDMRMKLLYDLAYVVALDNLWTYLKTELSIIVKTPWVMARGLGR